MPVTLFEPMSSRSDEGSAVMSSLDSPTWLSSKERGEQQEINNHFANLFFFFSQLVFIEIFWCFYCDQSAAWQLRLWCTYPAREMLGNDTIMYCSHI